MNINDTPIGEGDELIMFIPQCLMGEGEAGDPLSPQVVSLIMSMVPLGYGPLDFGEGDDKHSTLYFFQTSDPLETAKSFIRKGGCE